MENVDNKSSAVVSRILTFAVVAFIVLMVTIWFFKEDIDLAVVPESKAGTELNISSASSEANTDNLLPSQKYVQNLLNDPNNFDTSEFENMLPAQALMHSKDMFLVGF